MKKIVLLCLCLIINFVSISQDIYQPRNLKQAVKFLDENSPQSLKDSVIKTDDDLIEEFFYLGSKEITKDKHVFEWTAYPSKLKMYLTKKGLKYFYKEVLLSSFKYYLINGKLDEKKILLLYIEKSKRYAYEDENRKTIDTLRGVYIPKDLDDCFKQLGVILEEETINEIKRIDEEELGANFHFGLGRWMRNNWQLWKGSRLSYYFNNIGVYHPDDMSGIILTSYQRHLKGEDIKLEEQIKHYQDYWIEMNKKEEEEKKVEEDRKNEEFNKFNIGDTIDYRYTFDFVSEEQEEKWYNEECNAKGVVLAKNQTDRFIKVKIIECCDRKGIIVLDTKDMYKFDKKLNTWVNKKRVIKKAKKGKTLWFEFQMWEPIGEY